MANGTTSFWIQENRQEESFDVAIVGGGIVGCSAAYWLRRLKPGLRLGIVERGYLGSGASSRNAGFILQGSATAYKRDIDRFGPATARRLFQLTLDNRNLIADELASVAIQFDPCGSITAAGSEDEAYTLEMSQQLLASDGFECGFLNSTQLAEAIGSSGFFGGLRVPTGAAVDPVRLLREVAQASGASVLEFDPCLSVQSTASGVVLQTEHRVISAPEVLFATNAYLPLLFDNGIHADLVRPVRAQMFVTEPLPAILPMPVYSHDGYYYIRQHRPTGRLLVGGARHLHVEDEIGYKDETTTELQEDLQAYAREYFPLAAGLKVANRWSGTMGFSPDSRPILAAVPGVPGARSIGGFTGHGMSVAFRVGLLLARSILGEADPYLDLFDANRLAPA